MSDDPRTDFFAASADTAPQSDEDTRTAFFANDKVPDLGTSTAAAAEPAYDAALFKKRVGRDPEPAELGNFQASKGKGWAGDAGTNAGSFKGMGEAALAAGAGTLKAVTHAANDILPGSTSRADLEKEIQADPILNYRGGPEAQPYLDALGNVTYPISWAANKLHKSIAAVAGERTADVAGDLATIVPGALRISPKKAWDKAVASMDDPESVAAATGSQQSISAAASAPDLTGVSPELRAVAAGAKNPNSEVLERHIDAETLPLPDELVSSRGPLRLRKGQATQNDQQISDEKNLRADPDTDGHLSASITDQNDKLGASMGEIRRRATPDIVQRSTPEHAQSAIDAIKTEDNARLTDMRAKYKALADANGGALPLDTSQTLTGIKADLDKGFLNKTAHNNPVVSEVLENLESGRPMTFEEFENARTNLADVQRQGGADAKAAAIVRNQLESMPLTGDAAKLKGLADTARAAARARHATIEGNPAYEAVVNDNVPKTAGGLHAVGAPSPLADTFMDRYFLGNGQNASGAYVGRLQDVMRGNPDFAPAVEAASLNKLRDSAGLDPFDTGNFRDASYRKTRNLLDKKADVLMSPQSAESTRQLERVSGYVNYEGKASNVNRSNTALTLQRYGAQYPETPGLTGTLADYATDLAAAHTGPVGYAVKKVGSAIYKNAKDRAAVESARAAKLKFAREATAPGAGIESAEPSVARATGGKVAHKPTHDDLVEGLMKRWHAARKQGSKATEPLLKLPDEAIVKALKLAGEHI